MLLNESALSLQCKTVMVFTLSELQIHITVATKSLLDETNDFVTLERGIISIKVTICMENL